MANVEGKATAITTMSPVKWWGRFFLPIAFWVARHFPSQLERLHTLSFIHYARWALVKRFPTVDGAEKPRYGYLLFESNFNGSWDEYIDAFSEVVPAKMSLLWASSYGFPGPIPVEPFKDYIRRTELAANHYWSAYPHASTTEVISAGRVAKALDDLKGEATTLEPEAFKRAYDEMLTKVQSDL